MSGPPLDGLRVVAVSQFGAGPFGTQALAELGAEVIKIEDPVVGGDVSRYVPPYQIAGDSLYFQSFNRGKKSLALDLRRPEATPVLHDLVRVSHGVYNNLRGDLPRKLGLTYETLGRVNPAIVCCSLSGFGATGPRAAEPAYDYLIQGYAGWMTLTGEPDGPPRRGLGAPDSRARAELRDARRLARRLLQQGEVLGGARGRARAAGAHARRALRVVRRPARAQGGAARDPQAAVRGAHDGGLAPAPARPRAVRPRELDARGARRRADPAARDDPRGRAPGVRHAPRGGLADPDRGRRHPAGARAAPRRAHRRDPARAAAVHSRQDRRASRVRRLRGRPGNEVSP